MTRDPFGDLLRALGSFFAALFEFFASAIDAASFALGTLKRDAKDRHIRRKLAAHYDTLEVLQKNAELARATGFPDIEGFMDAYYERYVRACIDLNIAPVAPIRERLATAAGVLYAAEQLDRPVRKTDTMGPIEEARYRDQLLARINKQSNPQTLELVNRALLESQTAFTKRLPKVAQDVIDIDGDSDEDSEENQPRYAITIPLLDVLPDIGRCVHELILPFFRADIIAAGLFADLRTQLESNQRVASPNPSKTLVDPETYDGSPSQCVRVFLQGTPLESIFAARIPFEIPERVRFEHHWIVAGTGHGKTNVLTKLILDDLERVSNGEASVVVMDSQNALIPTLAHLPVFAKGGPLDGKLVLIDASDVEYPVALNLFDVGLQRLDRYSMLDRERLLNTAAEVMEYILSALLGAEMTSRQSTLFGFALQAMQLIPNATIHTFRELMEPNGRKKFGEHLAKLEGRARDFFETQFDAAIFAQTKQQVVARLFAICENRTFDRMLTNPKSKLDLFSEINAGKVILINTAKDLLKQQGTEIFGRFFLALIAQAAQERATLPPSKRLPCYVYIDECQDYLSTDSNFTMILEQARKQNVGVIVAHQYLTQLSQKTLDSLYANTSIKLAGGVSDKDAYALARNMRCEPSFIAEQQKGSFAGYVRNLTTSAITLKFPLVRLEQERTADEEYAKIRDALRARYAFHYSQLSAPVPPRPAEPAQVHPPPVRAEDAPQPDAPIVPTEKRGKWPM
jgi:hypothetical protein